MGAESTGNPEPRKGPLSTELRVALRAVEDGASSVLRGAVNRSALRSPQLAFVEDFLCPLLRETGEGWLQGTVGVAEEHQASQVIREILGQAIQATAPSSPAPVAVCTTPPEQRHEFGALIAAFVASGVGWEPIYAGPDLPWSEIARLAGRERVRAVAVSILQPGPEAELRAEFSLLRQRAPGSVRIHVGGRPAALAAAERVPGVRGLSSFTELSRALASETGRKP